MSRRARWQGPCPTCGRVVTLWSNRETRSHKPGAAALVWCRGGYVSELDRTLTPYGEQARANARAFNDRLRELDHRRGVKP